MEFFLCNKRKIAVKPTVYQNSAVSRGLLENFKITDHKFQFESWKLFFVLGRYRLLGETTEQLLSNFESRKTWKYKQL